MIGAEMVNIKLNKDTVSMSMEEHLYLDEIEHIPLKKELVVEDSIFSISLADIANMNNYPRIFFFYSIDGNGHKTLIKKEDIDSSSLQNELYYEQQIFKLIFDKNSVLQLKKEKATSVPVQMEESEDFIYFYYRTTEVKFDIDKVKLGVWPKASRNILNNFLLSEAKTILLVNDKKNTRFCINKKEFFRFIIENAQFESEMPLLDVGLITDNNVTKISIEESSSSLLFDPFEIIMLNHTIQVKIRNRYKPTIKSIEFDSANETSIVIMEASEQVHINSVKFATRSIQYDENLKIGVESHSYKDKLSWISRINNEELPMLLLKGNSIVDCFANCTIKGIDMIVRPYAEKEIVLNDYKGSNFYIKPFVTKVRSLAFNIEKIVEESNVKKVAVFGSCYSRLMFSSSKYFNPDYKQYFSVMNTQFQTSTMSITTPAPGYEKISNYVDEQSIRQRNIDYLKTEFNKTYFQELMNAKAEYFIFDLYADSSLSLIDWGEGKLSTAMYYFKKELKQSLIDNEGSISIITHDVKGFFEEWKKSIDQFMKNIFSMFDKEKVILISSKRTYEFLDKNERKILNFYLYGNSIEVAKAADFWSEIMEDYILSNYPEIKFIDMEKYGYIGSLDHPQKLSTNHYESNYYKSLLAELRSITK